VSSVDGNKVKLPGPRKNRDEKNILYREKTGGYAKTNNFYSDYETWRKNREITGGQIEPTTATADRMVFKITDLKLKNVAGNEIAAINGTVSTDIQK
jgi:hypothetical protein